MFFKDKVDKAYKAMFGYRLDADPGLYYFDWRDLDGMKRDDFSFTNRFNEILRGGLYHLDNCEHKDTLVIFSHGYGGGHNSYIKEIYHIVKAGYRVLAIDAAGCIESEGTGLRGFNQQTSDTIDLLSYLKSLDEYKDLKIDLVGHSMGGYTSLNILNYVDGINKVVSLAGPVSFKHMEGPLVTFFISKEADRLEAETLPGFGKYTALDGAKKKGGTKILFIQSKDDPVVKWKYSGKIFAKVKNPNLSTIFIDGAGHQTCFTKEAAIHFNEFLVKYKKCKTLEEKLALKEVSDWNAICDHDVNTMSLITDFLKD